MNILLLAADAPGLNLTPAYLLVVLAGAGTVITFLYRQTISTNDKLIAAKEREFNLLMSQKEKALADLESTNKAYREVASESVQSSTELLSYYLKKEGKPPVVPLAKVIPESHSDSTPEQRVAADLADMRQKVAQLRLLSGQAPKPTPDKAGVSYVDEKVIPAGILGVIKNEIAQVPEKTATAVVEKIEEAKQEEGK